MIFNLDDIQRKKTETNHVRSSVVPTTPPPSGLGTSTSLDQSPSVPSSSQKGIVRKVIMTRLEINVYPDGTWFPGKSSTWIQGSTYTPRKKVKKVVKTKKAKIQKKEEW